MKEKILKYIQDKLDIIASKWNDYSNDDRDSARAQYLELGHIQTFIENIEHDEDFIDKIIYEITRRQSMYSHLEDFTTIKEHISPIQKNFQELMNFIDKLEEGKE